jgi:hypothetical protein
VGASSGLYGNGMVFSVDVLRDHAWTDHLTEDIELQMELLLAGQRVEFAPDAVVLAEMPATLRDSVTQNERWERGRIELARRYVPRLAKHAAATSGEQRLACIDAAVDQVVPPFSILVAATAVAGVAGGLVGRSRSGRRATAIGAATLGAQAGYALSALRMVRAPAAVYWSLLRAPAFVAWKVALWLRIMRHPDVGWIRTTRNGEGQ